MDNMRKRKSRFQMPSIGKDVIVYDNHMTTFKIQEQIYYLFGSMLLLLDADHQLLQSQFTVNDNEQIDRRMRNSNGLQ
uniref:Uncharacterized protein n=1 Tax=Glossina brevipalpis TaxID=37001 RepID=A0A1A9X4Y4_9MUSC